MNYLGVHIAPDLVEESLRELARQRELEWSIRRRRNEMRAARRAARIARFAAFVVRVRQVLQPGPRPAAEGC
jgi:hypothetical protein